MTNYLHHNNIDALLWLQTSAEWHASMLQAYALAKLRIAEAVATVPRPSRMCITTDLDETLFDNSAYNEWLVTTGHNFNETGSWERYCNEGISLAMPGAEDFYGWLAKDCPDVKVFFVTSRLESVRAATAANLMKLGNVPADGAQSENANSTCLFMKGTTLTWDGRAGSDKYAQYEFIEQHLGYETVLRLGDNASDFHPDFASSVASQDRLLAARKHAGEWGQRWIQFPNPVYGSFLLSLRNANKSPVVEDDGSLVGMTDEVVREPRVAAVTQKVVFLDPWAP